MKPFKEMTRQEQLDWVNSISTHLVPNGRRAMIVCNPQTEPPTYLHPGDIGDLMDVLADLLECEIERLAEVAHDRQYRTD